MQHILFLQWTNATNIDQLWLDVSFIHWSSLIIFTFVTFDVTFLSIGIVQRQRNMSESSDDCIILSSSESESTRKSASSRVHHNIKQEEQTQEQYEYSASPLPASKQIYCYQPVNPYGSSCSFIFFIWSETCLLFLLSFHWELYL